MSGLRTSGVSRHTIPSMVLADGCFRDSETAAQSPPRQRPTEDHGGAGGNAMAAMHGMMRGQGAGVANRAREKGWCDAGLQRQPAHELAAPVRSRLLHAARLKAAKSLGRARIAPFSTVSRRAGNIAPRLLASASPAHHRQFALAIAGRVDNWGQCVRKHGRKAWKICPSNRASPERHAAEAAMSQYSK